MAAWIYKCVSKKLFTDVECKHRFNVRWWNLKYTAVILVLLNKARAWNHTSFCKKKYTSIVSTFATTGYSLFLEFLKQNKHFFCEPRDDSLNALLYSVFVSLVYVKRVCNSIILRASRRYCVWRLFFSSTQKLFASSVHSKSYEKSRIASFPFLFLFPCWVVIIFWQITLH